MHGVFVAASLAGINDQQEAAFSPECTASVFTALFVSRVMVLGSSAGAFLSRPRGSPPSVPPQGLSSPPFRPIRPATGLEGNLTGGPSPPPPAPPVTFPSHQAGLQLASKLPLTTAWHPLA